LSVLERIARFASVSDRPPLATSGEGSLAILSQDTLQAAHQAIGAEGQFDYSSGQLTAHSVCLCSRDAAGHFE
jgi:hypothetical protein